MAEYGRAVEVYARCCEQHKLHSSVGLEYYSTALWHLREAVQLGSLAQRALEWDRLRPQTWCVVGNCLSLQHEHPRAIRALQRAVQLDPSHAYAHTLMAHEYAAIEKFDKATEMYQRALNVDCRHYNAWWGLGNIYLRREEYASAKSHFQRALAINGSNVVLRTSLAKSLQAMGQTGEALNLFTVPVHGQETSALAAYQQGCALTALGRFRAAVEVLKRALGLAPREACVHFELGRAHAGLGESRQALVHFTSAMDLSGAKDSKDHQTIASAHSELLRASAPARLQQGSLEA